MIVYNVQVLDFCNGRGEKVLKLVPAENDGAGSYIGVTSIEIDIPIPVRIKAGGCLCERHSAIDEKGTMIIKLSKDCPTHGHLTGKAFR